MDAARAIADYDMDVKFVPRVTKAKGSNRLIA